MHTLYRWIDALWQKLAEKVFVRFNFDLSVEQLREISTDRRIVFTLTHGGFIEWLILSSWSRKQGFGAILVANRKRILMFAKPLFFLQILFRKKNYADLIYGNETGPRLLLCPPSERKKPFDPPKVERLLSELYDRRQRDPSLDPLQLVPVVIMWRRHVRAEVKNPYEYILGFGSRATFIGKLWYLLRNRRDSFVRGLATFNMAEVHASEPPQTLHRETESSYVARRTRRRLLVATQEELRVALGPRQHSTHFVRESILRDPEMVKIIDEVAEEQGTDRKKILLRAYQNLSEIAADVRYRSIEFMYFFLRWLFTKLFDRVDVSVEQIQEIRELTKKKSIVYVSAHRSHLDYLLIPYVLYNHDISVPFVAAGINMAFWPFGNFMRSGGAFFIRRSFRGDKLYSACLRKYIEFLIKNRNNFYYFIEGTRSRSGKMLPPAYGLLKMSLEAFENKAVEDIAFVPVSISYEEVPESGAYSRELGGEKKVKESATELIKSRKFINKKIGTVFLRFGKPLLAQQIYNDPSLAIDEKLRTQKTAFTICKRISDVSPITAKSIVATVLLSHPKDALPLEAILKCTEKLANYAQASGMSLAAGKDSFRISVEKTLRHLNRSGHLIVDRANIPQLYSCDPKKRTPLNYYKNTALHCTIIPSIVNVACLASLSLKEEGVSGSLRERINHYALRLRNILKFEVFFSPTSTFRTELQTAAIFFAGKMDWDALTEDQLTGLLNLNKEQDSDAFLWCRIIADILESYCLLCATLRTVGPGSYEKKWLTQRALKEGKAELEKDNLFFPEAMSIQNFSNALLLLNNEGHLSIQKAAGKTEIKVPELGKDFMELEAFLKRLLRLIT